MGERVGCSQKVRYGWTWALEFGLALRLELESAVMAVRCGPQEEAGLVRLGLAIQSDQDSQACCVMVLPRVVCRTECC